MKRNLLLIFTVMAAPAPVAFAADYLPSLSPPEFAQMTGFPEHPNPNGPWGGMAYGIAADALGDGRFILYDGNHVLIQDAVASDSFISAASGYVGDPGFIAVAPDGHTCLLNAGFSGECWLFNANAPADAGAPVFTLDAFSGEWITDSHVLVDRAVWVGPGTFDYDAELGILDLSGAPAYTKVVDKGSGTASASLVCDRNRQNVYVCEGMTGETRRFAIADLLAAASPLDWTAGDLIGMFSAGGPGAVSQNGTLIFGGFNDFIEFVDPAAGVSVGTTDPSGAAVYSSYTVTCGSNGGPILAVSAEWPFPATPPDPDITGWISEEYESVPAAGPAAVMLSMCAILVIAYGASRRLAATSE